MTTYHLSLKYQPKLLVWSSSRPVFIATQHGKFDVDTEWCHQCHCDKWYAVTARQVLSICAENYCYVLCAMCYICPCVNCLLASMPQRLPPSTLEPECRGRMEVWIEALWITWQCWSHIQYPGVASNDLIRWQLQLTFLTKIFIFTTAEYVMRKCTIRMQSLSKKHLD